MQIPRQRAPAASRQREPQVQGPGAVGAAYRRVDWRLGGQRSTHSSSSKGYCAYYLLGMQRIQTGPCGKGTQCDWEDIPKGGDG